MLINNSQANQGFKANYIVVFLVSFGIAYPGQNQMTLGNILERHLGNANWESQLTHNTNFRID
jgi:hypothetical protein